MKNNVKQPLITVIVPTRERPDTLEKCLKTVVSQDYDNLNIVVSDNFSRDSTEDVVRSYVDSRITYLNTGKRLSMSHNWEFALSNIPDGWVTILGDDDGLLPYSLSRVAEVIEANDIQAIRSNVCSYAWPSVTGKEFGRLEVPLKSGYEVRDSKKWLSKVMNDHAHYPELPMLYNGGFLNMSVLNEIKRKSGTFYRSCNPDVYSAVTVSSIVNNYIYLEEPLALNGASRHSAGTSHFSLDQKSEQSPAQKFLSEENMPFHKDIPLCSDGKYPFSIQAMVYESYLQSAMFRDENRLITYAQQLEVILAAAGSHYVSVEEWAKRFASIHRLNYDEILCRARRKRLLRKLTSIPGRISSAFSTCRVGSPEEPIKDVYAASIAAAAIRNSRPSQIMRLSGVAGRVIEKIKNS